MEGSIAELSEVIRKAAAAGTTLCIRAGGTKDFYGNPAAGVVLDPRTLNGIVAYEPTELVITARAGTPLAVLERELTAHDQMLAFEPPHFGPGATVGGCVAAGLAGPRRASFGATYGSVRDFVLGARLLNGRGELLSFGGTVMKNVAGYDVARLLVGSLGILGVIVEASLKVLPAPVAESTLRFELDAANALRRLNEWGSRPLPLSASVWHDGRLTLRLSGATAAVVAAREQLGGEIVDAASAVRFWEQIREHTDAYFAGDAPLWRLSVPSSTAMLPLAGDQLIEWGGAQRWLRTLQSAQEIRHCVQLAGGHATLFRGGDRSQGAFTPLTPAVDAIHKRLKAEFDPAGIFNPGRMFLGL